MEQDTRKRAIGAALVAVAAAGALAGPAAAGGKDGDAKPPEHAPAHGVRGETPPEHAPARGLREEPPAAGAAPARAGGGKERRAGAAKPRRGAKAARPAPPAHAPARGVRAAQPRGTKAKAKAKPPRRTSRSGERSSDGRPKETLCHATGSDKNPYVTITIADRGVQRAHEGHQHDGDIIPAPEGGCPGASEAAARATAGARRSIAGGAPETGAAASSGAPVTASGAPAGGGEPVGILTSSHLGSEQPRDGIEVLGAVEREAPEATAASAAAEAPEGGLPFTGLHLIAVIAAGLAALLTGIALWRATRARPTA